MNDRHPGTPLAPRGDLTSFLDIALQEAASGAHLSDREVAWQEFHQATEWRIYAALEFHQALQDAITLAQAIGAVQRVYGTAAPYPGSDPHVLLQGLDAAHIRACLRILDTADLLRNAQAAERAVSEETYNRRYTVVPVAP